MNAPPTTLSWSKGAPAIAALDPDLIELVKALARANAARDIAAARQKDSTHART